MKQKRNKTRKRLKNLKVDYLCVRVRVCVCVCVCVCGCMQEFNHLNQITCSIVIIKPCTRGAYVLLCVVF